MITVFGTIPWEIVTTVGGGAATWAATMWHTRDKRKTRATEVHDRLEIHRDEFTFELLQNARVEMSAARIEMEALRSDVRKLRSMELHFFHFQQSLDHLEALLLADTPELLATAKRNARAFLVRMRRLSAAKGTIANEVQRASSEVSIAERVVGEVTEPEKKDG